MAESAPWGDYMQELHKGVHWINECYDIGDAHEHVSVFLIHDQETDRFILVDSGSFYHRDAITTQISDATDGEGVNALILSHSDYPHSANVREFAAEGSETELVASSGSPLAQGLPTDATRARIGDSLTVVGREFSFIDPPLADRSHTTWIYDHVSEVLFAADGFGSYHVESECEYTSREFDDGIPADAIYEFHVDTLVWLRYVDPGKLQAALESIFEAFPPSYVAPIHGHPIAAADLDQYMDRLIGAAERIEGECTVPE